MDDHVEDVKRPAGTFGFDILASYLPMQNQGDEAIFIVDHRGDLILTVHDEDGHESVSFRASSEVLKQSSGYFRGLLAPNFHTGVKIASGLEQLAPQPRGKRRAIEDMSTTALPRLETVLGAAVSRRTSIKPLVAGFLLLLHLEYEEVPNVHRRYYRLEELPDFIAIADWFGALDAVRRSIRSSIDPKRQWKPEPYELSEDALRQRIFVASCLCLPVQLQFYTAAFIDRGFDSILQDLDVSGDLPVWWNLPYGLEEEIRHRRECVLSKIEQLVKFVFNEYLGAISGKSSQCKHSLYGFMVCDAVHFDRLSKFLTDVVGFPELLLEGEEPPARCRWPPAITLKTLIARLGGVPTAWLDKDHMRCGPRFAMVEGLYLICCMIDPELIGIGVEGCELALHGHPSRQMQDTTCMESNGPLPKRWLETGNGSSVEPPSMENGDDDEEERRRAARPRRWPKPWPWPHWKAWLAREFLTSREVDWKKLIDFKPKYVPNGRLRRGVLKIEDAFKSRDTTYC